MPDRRRQSTANPCAARRFALVLACALVAGCGTTRLSDSSRTANEQLLISSAVDRAVGSMRFEHLSGHDVFFDPQYLKGAVDENYIVSTIRQQLLASGCYLKERREDAQVVVEARAGAVGTNRHDLLIGIPQVNLPSAVGVVGAPSVIPEIPFAKSTDQKGVAKISVFAYKRETGEPIWQSGAYPMVASAHDTWVLGAGPFQRGTIYEGTRFAGSRLRGPFRSRKQAEPQPPPEVGVPVAAEVVFTPRGNATAANPGNDETAGRSTPLPVHPAAASEAISPPGNLPAIPQILRPPPPTADGEGSSLLPLPGHGPLGRFFHDDSDTSGGL